MTPIEQVREALEAFFEEHVPCECESEHGITCNWCHDTDKLLGQVSALSLLKTMEGEPEITSHESGYQLGVKHGHEQMREIFEGISPRGGEAFLDSSLRYVIALREKIIELQSPSPQSDALTVDSAMQVVREWKSLEMNGWSADAIWDNLEHLLTKAAAK